MFNPYVIIVALVGAIGLFASGVSGGVKWERRDALANLTAVQNKAIEDANTAVEAAVKRTVASAKKEANARLAARTARMKGELDVAKTSRIECARLPESVRLLNDAVAAANDEAPATGKLPDEVRPDSTADGWGRKLRSAMGISTDRTVRDVPPDARGLRGVEQ